MKRHNQITVSISTAIMLLLISGNLFAQYPGMAAFRAQQNMQFIQRQMFMQMSMMNYYDRNYNPSYTFIVTFKDSSSIIFDSQILNDTTLKKNYLLFIDKKFKRSDTNRYKTIFPSQTISIERKISTSAVLLTTGNVEQKPNYLVGTPADSCWVFKVISGPISAYSSLSELPGNSLFKPFAILSIQLNNGPIVKYTPENLKQMIGQDDEAMKYFDKKKYIKALDRYNSNIEKAAKK